MGYALIHKAPLYKGAERQTVDPVFCAVLWGRVCAAHGRVFWPIGCCALSCLPIAITAAAGSRSGCDPVNGGFFMKFQSDYVVCIGRTIQDDYYRLDRLPVPGNKVNSVYLESRPGGGMANTTCVAASLGTHTYLVGPIGDDFRTEELLRSVSDLGGDVSHMYRAPGEKNFVHEIFLYGDERIIMLHRGEKLLSFREDAEKLSLINHAAVVYSDILSFQYFSDPVGMLRRAAAGGTRVFIDAEPGSIRDLEEAEQYFSLASIISFNDFAMDFYCGREGEDKIRRLIGDTDKIVILTKAKDGAVVLTRDGRTAVPSYPVPVTDTTGAGDTFNGALIHGLLSGLDPVHAAVFANKAASYCVAHTGARAAAVDPQTILDYIKPYEEE